jgi:ATP-binding cassette subfamily B protein
LDEATSSVDSETESMIQKAIETLTKNRTSIIIAHRLATVQHVDNILVLEHGEIVESGNHQTLINQKGKYADLYERQFLIAD